MYRMIILFMNPWKFKWLHVKEDMQFVSNFLGWKGRPVRSIRDFACVHGRSFGAKCSLYQLQDINNSRRRKMNSALSVHGHCRWPRFFGVPAEKLMDAAGQGIPCMSRNEWFTITLRGACFYTMSWDCWIQPTFSNNSVSLRSVFLYRPSFYCLASQVLQSFKIY